MNEERIVMHAQLVSTKVGVVHLFKCVINHGYHCNFTNTEILDSSTLLLIKCICLELSILINQGGSLSLYNVYNGNILIIMLPV